MQECVTADLIARVSEIAQLTVRRRLPPGAKWVTLNGGQKRVQLCVSVGGRHDREGNHDPGPSGDEGEIQDTGLKSNVNDY
jgi:hypothetical protein